MILVNKQIMKFTSLAYISAALNFVWQSSRKWTILLIISQLLQAILPLINLYLIKLIVDEATESQGAEAFNEILYYIVAFGMVKWVQSLIQNYQLLISETQQQLVSDYMSNLIIDKAISLDLSYYENSKYHDTFHQAQRQAMYRPVQILRALTDFLRTTFLLISIAGLLIFLHWGIAIVLIFFALPIAAVKWYYSKKLYEWESKRTHLEREAHYLNEVLTADTYAKEVRIFALGEILKQNFIAVRKALFQEKYRIGRQRVSSGILAHTFEILALTATYGFIVWRTFRGNITVGDLVMYFQAFQQGQAAIQQALASMVNIYNNRLFLTHIFDLLKVSSRLQIVEKTVPLPSLSHAVQLQNVQFQYPETERQVLKDINLEFKKGQVIALVGENGSGKTSLVKLLCRLYDPTAGHITWDGINIKHVDVSELRQRISVIYQDFAKYHFTLDRNIRIGELALALNEEKRQMSIEKSGASDMVNNLPKGFEQQLGRKFKNGTELSGGQWQKVALARAFYKNAEIIILDEPSSAIDPLAEAAIFEHFREIAKDKILILVTHRLYNLKIADQIVVLQMGKIVEQGTHAELLERQGLYTSMFKKQQADT